MPRYPSFPRSNVAGSIPTDLDPGTIAVNWPDRKIYVGDASSIPRLLGYPVRTYKHTSAYREEDVVVYNDRLYQCSVTYSAPGPFDPGAWKDLTAVAQDGRYDLTSSVLLSGGFFEEQLSLGSQKRIRLYSGSGVTMDVSDPAGATPTFISWDTKTISVPKVANQNYAVSINADAVVQFTPVEDYRGDISRTTVFLGTLTTDSFNAIRTTSSVPRAAYQTRDTLTDFLRATGPFKTQGLEITPGATTTSYALTAGEAFWESARWFDTPSDPNRLTVETVTPLELRMAMSSGFTSPTDLRTEADPSQWDNASVLQAVPVGKYTNQFFFLDVNLEAVVLYGQQIYDTKTAAIDAISSDFQLLLAPAVIDGLLLLGVVCSNNDGSDQTIANLAAGPEFGGSSGGSGDLSQYLLINGSRPMTGDLDLGGSGIVNGEIDGGVVEIKPLASAVTGEIPTGVDDQITVNTSDDKVYLGSQLVSQRVGLFSAGRAYKIGDLAILSNVLYRCTTNITPGAFNAANWQAIGGGGGSAGAVVKEPVDDLENVIDLTVAGGGATAFRVDFDGSQSVNVADFGPRASVNRFGVPVGAFGGAVFVVNKATHGFTSIGTALYFDGLNWVLADNGDPSRYPNAIVAEIIDANTFTVQVAGRITGLNAGAFVGGVITPGTFYYASATSGLLTSTAGSTPVPVLYAISATTGIVKLTGTVIPTVITIPEVVNALYPVGSLYMSVDPANPSIQWPGTTWVAHAAGRALVGVGSNGEGSYNVGQQRGTETHILTAAQIPAHTHTVNPPETNTSTDGNHTHNQIVSETGGGSVIRVTKTDISGGFLAIGGIQAAGSHDHSVNIPEFSTGSIGGSGAHPNIQPSIGVYVWRRTA